ncbi:MAG: class I SAM-dependent methyltransferase [Hymenobacter sp.]
MRHGPLSGAGRRRGLAGNRPGAQPRCPRGGQRPRGSAHSGAGRAGRPTPASFDTVTLWHVLEHVHTLQETIGQLVKVLKPGGQLLVAGAQPR